MSAYYYTTTCSFCEHPIKKGTETKGVFTEWTHSDKNVCRENIRADEAARHHDGGDCECTSAMDLVAEKDAEIAVLKSRLLTTYGVLGGMLTGETDE